MAINDLFDHTCDIYHMVEEYDTPGYGLPHSPCFSYPLNANENGVICHFSVRGGNNTAMAQNEPQNEFSERTKLCIPIDTDIRLHDKVVDCTTGLEYTVVKPIRNIRNNHLMTYVERSREQKPL